MIQTDVSNDCWLELFAFPALGVFFMDDKKNKVADLLPARFVGSAYYPDRGFEDNFIVMPVTIYAVGDDEYLVPTENESENVWQEDSVKISRVRLDQAQKIELRPFDEETGEPTRKIPEMILSTEILPEVMESLLVISKQGRKNRSGYRAEFILPEPK